MWLFFIYETFQKKIIANFFKLAFACVLIKFLNLWIYVTIFFIKFDTKKKKKIEFAIINAELKSVGFSGYLKHVYG